MKCSVARESLSAWADGEDAQAGPLEVSRHLAECADCAAFAEQLGDLSEVTSTLMALTVPTDHVGVPEAAKAGEPRLGRVLWLRVAVVGLVLIELVATGLEVRADHGYGAEDHAGHESVALTLAVCAGLLWIAWRPGYARAYLPLIGVAAVLLVATAAADVITGAAGPLEEIPHASFLVAFVLLWLLSHDGGHHPHRRWVRRRPPAPPEPTGGPRLTAVRRSLRAAAVGVAPVAVVLAAPAWGHATLEASNPGSDALVATMPATVSLRFSESVGTLPTSLQVYAPDGTRVDDGDVTHPDGDGARLSVGVSGSQEGTYLVSWRVVSADSHPIAGAFTFSVGTRSDAPTGPSSHSDPTVSLLLGAFRWLGYAGAALALGGLAFLVVCWPEGWASARAVGLVRWGFVLIAIGSAASLLLKGPYDAALGLSATTNGSLLREVLGSTYGRAEAARLLLAFAAVLLVPRHGGRPGRVRIGLLGAAGLGMVLTYAVAGHAVSDAPAGVAIPVDMVHVAAMSVWFGGLLMLVELVLQDDTDHDVASRVVRRFSTVAISAVVALVVTGTYQGWRQVRSWGALTSTTYGHELLWKLALVAGVLLAATASRRWVRRSETDLSVLRRRVSVEAFGLVAVLGVTSALVTTQPADTAYRPTINADLKLGPDRVRVSAVPAGDRKVDLHLWLYDDDQQPTEPKAVSATMYLKPENIGPLPLILNQAGQGHRVGDVAVPVTGDWTLTVDVRTSPIDEYTQTMSLPIR